MVEVKKVSQDNVQDLYRVCIPCTEEYARATKESSDFFLAMKEKGGQGLVAYEEGNPVGRVEFYPLEESFAGISGEGLYFMPCAYIVRDHQRKGYGRALLEEVLSETSKRKGLVTVTCRGWMPREFFEKLGFELVQQIGEWELMLKKYEEDANAEILPSNFTPKCEEDKVSIEVVTNPQCPYMTVNYSQLVKKAKEVSDRVEVSYYLLRERQDIEKYGEMNLYVEGKAPFIGPGREEEIETLVKEHLRRKGL